MSVATITPRPRLAVVASEARKEARNQKRSQSKLRKVARGFSVALAVIFATMALGSGTAQAWPWTDMQEDITAFVTNFCGPEDVPTPVNGRGIDNLFGLNNQDSDIRGTVKPNTKGLGKEPLNGLERVQSAYEKQADLIKPTYERYGFSTLRWDAFGAGCFNPGYWFTPIADTALQSLVISPIMLGMTTLNVALGNILYTVFTGVISPFVSIFTAIFKGWALWLAPIGIIWAFIRSKGNLRVVAKTGAWMLMIFGVFLWMGNNTSTIVTKANNFVTDFAGSAATQINEITGVSTGESGTAIDSINQSLWYGVPYNTWLEGTIGPHSAGEARTADQAGQTSWGGVLLNSRYVGIDKPGRGVRGDIDEWNNLSYSPNEELADEALNNMKTKPGAWTKGKMWEKIPYLFTVKALCADTSNGAVFTSSSAEDDNKWFYGGSCDSAAAGTANIIPHFTGTDYNSRFAAAFSGAFAALAVFLAVAAASIYLGVQKMLFYFLLLFGPVFLTVAMFGDEKRAAFAKRYGELMIANLIKQGVAVLVVLFVANAMSMLLYPPSSEDFAALREIPWMLKPTLALFFLIGLALFLMPMKRIVTGAVKGDTSVVDKTANMPVDAAKTAAKAGAVVVGGAAAVAAVAATGGAAAPAVAKFGGMAMSAGRTVGARGGVGKVLTGAGRAANLASRVGGTIGDGKNKKAALGKLAQGLFSRDSKAQAEMKQIPGAVDENGKLTKKGEAVMSRAIKQTSKTGQNAARSEALQKSYMDQFYKGHLAKTGQHHAMDPNSPENQRAAAVEKEQERRAVKRAAKRRENMGAGAGGSAFHGGTAPNDGNDTTAPNGGGGGSTNHGPNSGQGNGNATFVVNGQGQAQYADMARENVSGPGFAQDQTVKANVSLDGSQIAQELGLSTREVAQNPASLISSSAYGGGDVAQMDPRHPATASMNDLKFAMIANDQEGISAATVAASDAISQHGVPSQVTSVAAVEPSTEGMATAIGAMPTISDDTPWQTRAEGATAMQAAMSFVAEDSPAREPMVNYVQALSDPTVDASTVAGLQSIVIETASPDLSSAAPATPDLTEAIRESAQAVSMAPAETVASQGPLFGESAPQTAAPESQPQAQDAPLYGPAPAYNEGGSFFGGDSGGPGAAQSEAMATDLLGNTYYDLPPSAVDAMPSMPAGAQGPDSLREGELNRYRAEMEAWRADYDILPPSGWDAPSGRHSSGGYAPEGDSTPLFSGAGSGLFRGSKPGAPPPDDMEEISGMPYEEHEDNSVQYKRSRRRRISGFFDMEDEDEGGE